MYKDSALDDFYNILRFHWTEFVDPAAAAAPAPLLALEDIRPDDTYEEIEMADPPPMEDHPGSDAAGFEPSSGSRDGPYMDLETQIDEFAGWDSGSEDAEPERPVVPSAGKASPRKPAVIDVAEAESSFSAEEVEKPPVAAPSLVAAAEMAQKGPLLAEKAEKLPVVVASSGEKAEKPPVLAASDEKAEKTAPVPPASDEKAEKTAPVLASGEKAEKTATGHAETKSGLRVQRQKQHIFKGDKADCQPARQQIRYQVQLRVAALRPHTREPHS